MILVRNLNGTAGKTCKCASWKAHWENYTGGSSITCRAAGCGNYAIDGAHVKKVNGNDNSHYIVPLCRSCNKYSDSFYLNESARLAPANVAYTCARW